MDGMLIRIDSGYFCAGVVAEGKTIVRVAPILKYMKGWTVDRVFAYAKRKGWKCQRSDTPLDLDGL